MNTEYHCKVCKYKSNECDLCKGDIYCGEDIECPICDYQMGKSGLLICGLCSNILQNGSGDIEKLVDYCDNKPTHNVLIEDNKIHKCDYCDVEHNSEYTEMFKVNKDVTVCYDCYQLFSNEFSREVIKRFILYISQNKD